MAEMDRYVRAIQDLLGQLGSPAERLHAMEEVIERFAPADTRKAAGGFVSDLAATPERMLEVRRILGEFASPGKQLRAFEEQLASTRKQLELMAHQIEGVESTVGRLADLADQLGALQEPFTNLTQAFRGGGERSGSAAVDDEGDEGGAPVAPV